MLKKFMVILCAILCVWNGGCADSRLEEIALETSDSGEVQEEILSTIVIEDDDEVDDDDEEFAVTDEELECMENAKKWLKKAAACNHKQAERMLRQYF